MPREAPLVKGTSSIIASAIVVITTPVIITPASRTSFSVVGTKPSSTSNTSPHVKTSASCTSSIHEWPLQNYFTVNFVFFSHILDLGTEVFTKQQRRRKLAFFAETLHVFG